MERDVSTLPAIGNLQAIRRVSKEPVEFQCDDSAHDTLLNKLEHTRAAWPRLQGLSCAHASIHDDFGELEPSQLAVRLNLRPLRRE